MILSLCCLHLELADCLVMLHNFILEGTDISNESDKKLIQKLKRPIVSTSANISGKPHGKSLSEIDNLIKSKVDCCVDDNHKELNNPPSKIIKINLDGSFKIIRK